MRQLGGRHRSLTQSRIAPRCLYAYQQAVRRQLDTQVAGFAGERTGVIELALNRPLNLSHITADIRPAGARRFGIALPGRFTVALRFGTAAFRRVLAIRQAAKQIANFLRLFRSLGGGLLLGVRSGFFGGSGFLGRRFLLCLGGSLLLGFRCSFFLGFSGRFLLRGLCSFLFCRGGGGFLRLFRLFLGGGGSGRFFLGFRFGFFWASACALATLSASAFALAAAASATFCCSLALAAAASAAFCCSAACFCCSAAFCCCSACALASCAAFSCAAKRSFSSSFRRCCCSACFC